MLGLLCEDCENEHIHQIEGAHQIVYINRLLSDLGNEQSKNAK